MPDPALILTLALAAVLAGVGVHRAIPRLMPVFVRYALARPNGRSSHRAPTPQGGGLPVVAAVAAIVAGFALAGAFAAVPLEASRYHTLSVFAAVALALMGAADDMRPMPASARFVMQAILAAVVVFAAPAEWRLFAGWLPVAAERALAVVGFIWMVNLTNFMDGIDQIVVVEAAPVAAMLALIAAFGLLDAKAGVIAAALAGGVLGFAPHNRHPAKLFLGDVGSLPVGFLLASLLFQFAATVSIAAALLLPLYFVADATATLIAGARAGHDLTRPHRRHAYQRAVDSGWPAPTVTRAVLVLNIGLAALAAACVVLRSPWIVALLAALGAGATAWLIRRFRSGPP